MPDIVIQNDENLESVNYHVVENAAASKIAGKPVYTGIVKVKETYNTAAVARRMVESGCAVKAATIQLVLIEFADLIGKLAAEGRAVNISGLVRFAPAVRGTFDSPTAPWDKSKNELVVNASVGTRLRAAAAESSRNRTDSNLPMPTLTRVVDLKTVRDGVITSEGAFFVMGSNLTWDDTQTDEGFFLTYGLQEHKCILCESVQDPTCAAIRTDVVFEESGESLTLTFRTRLNGTLHQFVYVGELVSA